MQAVASDDRWCNCGARAIQRYGRQRRNTGGFVVTSGRFTSAAIQFAAGRHVELIDGVKLMAQSSSVYSLHRQRNCKKHATLS